VPRFRGLAVGLCLLCVVPGSVSAQKTPAAAFQATSGAAMFAVARAMAEETWNPILDRRIQEAPAARGLGAAWTSTDPRWQKARQALAGRMTRVFEAYARSPEIAGHITTQVGRMGAGPDMDAAVKALTGPAGPAVVRMEARREFIVSTLSAAPGGPEIGGAEWNAQIRDTGQRFDARVGPSLPPDDGSHKAEIEKVATSPAEKILSRVWSFVVSNAKRQLDTALNLMIFDEQAAIDADIKSAIGNSAPAARVAQAAPFSLDKLATCQDSWLEWKDDADRVSVYRDGFRSSFRQRDADPFFTPIGKAAVLGFPIAQVFPATVGMGVGFSVSVDAPFDRVKKGVEQAVGKTLKQCETGEGMRTCSLEIAEKKTLMLLGDATGKTKTTLIGCFYYYEK
jgi:hypothetical protein